ncbi:hypothetical protein GCM10010317_000700 [Streptomyces mirabilis]|nr:hypothetical protein GCM10010317_000700 [Streptomyces mirabilis]
MSPADPAIDRLVEAARHAPAGLIARLVESDDFRESRLGQAIRDVQRAPSHPDAADAGTVVDPVTHDPGW